MKLYNQTNFFKHTFCEFKQVDIFKFPENTNYKSKSESEYFYADEGVYRKSNHWGRVANCRWKLIADENYKNQQIVIGFAKWADFYPINSSEKIFIIEVDFTKETAKIQARNSEKKQHLFSFAEAQKRSKQISYLFKNTNWAKHFDLNQEEVVFKVLSELVNSDKELPKIKQDLRN